LPVRKEDTTEKKEGIENGNINPFTIYRTLPRKNSMAEDINITGQIFNGVTDVLAPLRRCKTAIIISIRPDSRYTMIDTGF
jgi:hypothetical protein